MVPAEFSDWREDRVGVNQIVDPSQQEKLGKIYSDILSRVYVNADGYRIMLSIAYGKNQNGNLQLHKPERCYPAQGFEVLSNHATRLTLSGADISAVRLTAKLGQRFEPITYWTVVGDSVPASMTDKRLIEVRYAMVGLIPDGMIVRVSSIDRDAAMAAQIQERFAKELIESIAPSHRNRFAGKSIASTKPAVGAGT